LNGGRGTVVIGAIDAGFILDWQYLDDDRWAKRCRLPSTASCLLTCAL